MSQALFIFVITTATAIRHLKSHSGGSRGGHNQGLNKPERHSGAQKFTHGAFRLQNYWISQPEPTFLGPAS